MHSIFLTHSNTARELYYGNSAIALLRSLANVVLNDTDQVLSIPQLQDQAGDCSIIISDRATAAPAGFFEALPNLKLLSRCAVDVRNIDLEAANKHNVLVTKATPGFAASVSELIIGMIIDLSRNISETTIAYRQGMAPPVRVGKQLQGSIIGIIGFGTIGRHLAPMAQALGMRVLIHDPYKTTQEPDVEFVAFEALLQHADYVVPLAVANDETENMINAEALGLMRSDAFLINASRGNLIDEQALKSVLLEGRIRGAAMDVGRAADQMPDPELAAFPNVIATPHIGGLTPDATQHQAMDTVRQVEQWLKGEVPQGALNAS